MIYTLTLNPAIDCYIWTDAFVPGKVNRCKSEELRVGGKGINVSIVLRILGLDSVILGFVAGSTGNMIQEELGRLRLRSDLIRLADGMSRINVKIQAEAETAINATGPFLGEGDFRALLAKMDSILRPGDTIILSGSIPESLPDTTYGAVASRYKDRARLVVDAEGALLRNTLAHEPFLIKPNLHEIGELFGVAIETEGEILHYGRKLCDMGARNVLVSRGREGAILLSSLGEVLVGKTPDYPVRSTVGAGDAMIGGFIAGYEDKRDLEQAFVAGIAASTASVCAKGIFSREDAEHLIPLIGSGCSRREAAKSH